MARDRLSQQPGLPEVFSEALSDFADLFRKELNLARAELSSNMSAKLKGTIWFSLAGYWHLPLLLFSLGPRSLGLASGFYDRCRGWHCAGRYCLSRWSH
jgi:hypothetical protein